VGRVDLIKLDVDGNEHAVISGARRILESCHPIMLVEAVGPHFGDDAMNPFLVLKQLGYRLWDAGSGREYVGLSDLKALLRATTLK